MIGYSNSHEHTSRHPVTEYFPKSAPCHVLFHTQSTSFGLLKKLLSFRRNRCSLVWTRRQPFKSECICVGFFFCASLQVTVWKGWPLFTRNAFDVRNAIKKEHIIEFQWIIQQKVVLKGLHNLLLFFSRRLDDVCIFVNACLQTRWVVLIEF